MTTVGTGSVPGDEVQALAMLLELAVPPGVMVMSQVAPALSVPIQVLLVIKVPVGNPEVLTCTLFADIEPV
ncbi:hypothetical protein, partial [Legionella jamestowniensis]|uniref:hypothetical protein n=2 Tax=Legionella jamestowniensis TaxID=455 RepID=UPI001F5E80EF